MEEINKRIALEFESKDTFYLKRNSKTENLENGELIVLKKKEYVVISSKYCSQNSAYETPEIELTKYILENPKVFFKKYPSLKISPKKKDLTNFLVNS